MAHLSEIPFDIVNKDISILIEGDTSQLHIDYDVVMGRSNQSIETLAKLGWVLLGGKTRKGRINASLNHIVTSNVDELVQKFWKVESFGTLPKKDQNLLSKWRTCSSDSRIYHDQRKG